MYYLFYSNHCNTCKIILNLFNNNNLASKTKLICVDGKTDKLPLQIKKIPALVIEEEGRILTDKEIFFWIESIRYLNNSNVKKNKNPFRDEQFVQQDDKPSKQSSASNKIDDNTFHEVIRQQMGGISDKFTYVDIDDPLPHTYFSYGKENEFSIHTEPEKDKINKSQQAMLLNNLKFQRINDSNEFKTEQNRAKYTNPVPLPVKTKSISR